MKWLWTSLHWLGGMVLAIIGMYASVEIWVVGKVNTAIEPTQVEVRNLKENISDIKADVRAIGIHLMGESKLNKMSANQGEK